MVHIRLLHTLIKEHATRHQVQNTFAVSTLLHTPSMYWYEADGDVPTPTYVNFKHVVDRTNLKIREFRYIIHEFFKNMINCLGFILIKIQMSFANNVDEN